MTSHPPGACCYAGVKHEGTATGEMKSVGDVETYATPADTYEQHIRDAQEAEQLGYQYYFFIEHQNAPFAYVSSPSVYRLPTIGRAWDAVIGQSCL